MLLKRVTTGGIHVDVPVCGAEVEVYEVDPIPVIFARIPDHGFATFKHAVVRGATELPPPVTSSGAVGPPPGVHVETHGVGTLLGSCTIAGFAEALSVWATATNGWSRLDEYDRHRLQAFALAPEQT